MLPSRCMRPTRREALAAAVLLAGCGGPSFNPFAIVPDDDIVFTRAVEGGTDVFLKGTGEVALNLTNLPGGKNAQPALSPDAQRVVFASRRDGPRSQLYVMNRDGTEVQRLTTTTASDRHPAWSPDGTKLAFVSDRDGVSNLYVMNADGTGVTRLTQDAQTDDAPCWSPDGLQLVFSSELGSSVGSPVPRVYRVDADGQHLQRLSGDGEAHELEPSWAITGLIVFTRSTQADGAQLYTMKPDGSEPTRLTGGTPETGGWHPSWSPPGGKIVFVSDRTGGVRLFAMKSTGADVMQLSGETADFEPDWAPLYRGH